MHLWVTRPIEDAGALRAQLIAQGHEVTLEPLLRIEYFDDEPIELDDAQALIATSKNALRALAGRPEEDACKSMPLFAVGRGTAQAAKAMGFETIIEGPSSAAALVGLIVNPASVNEVALVHLAAERALLLEADQRHRGVALGAPLVAQAVRPITGERLEREPPAVVDQHPPEAAHGDGDVHVTEPGSDPVRGADRGLRVTHRTHADRSLVRSLDRSPTSRPIFAPILARVSRQIAHAGPGSVQLNQAQRTGGRSDQIQPRRPSSPRFR